VDDARYFDEGKLVVFKRNRIYQHRSFLNGTYVWRTLKTSTLEEAITRAQKAHYYLLAQQEQGLPIKATLFRDVIDEYVASREKSASQGKTKPGMLRQIKRVVKFWREYAGSKRIHDIGDAEFSDYVELRRDYYTNLYFKLGKPLPHNAKLHPADKTLQWEVMLGKAIIKWAHAKGLRGYYVYGLLHSPDYLERFADNLGKELPRVPLVKSTKEFWAFSKAGRELADLHINYEKVPMHAGVKVIGGGKPGDYRVEKMRYGKAGKDRNLSTLHYNERIAVTGIPLEAYEYVVNGKPALDWVVERQCVRTDKDSGIVNDANDWAIETMKNPKYPLELFLRIITVSIETMNIIKAYQSSNFWNQRSCRLKPLFISPVKFGSRGWL
jgi:hypothetical protein